jgi:murein DD-endopeptidase MepM/ murein hydrolase activator NlpD
MKWWAWGGAGTLVVITPIIAVVASVATLSPTGICLAPAPSQGASPPPGLAGLTQAQITNAGLIIKAGLEHKDPVQPRGLVIAIATALQECGLDNCDHGDAAGPDSLGVFQQRANWGPASDRRDPFKAAMKFFDALLKVPNWESRPLGDVAYDVQHFDLSNIHFYNEKEPRAKQIVTALTSACQGAPGKLLVPLQGPSNPVVTQDFGCTDFFAEPPDPSCAGGHFHNGVDLAKPAGTPVLAAAAGTVTRYVDEAHSGGYGNVLVIQHGGGITTLYAHLQNNPLFNPVVRVGDTVAAGQVIAAEGSTGNSTGPHLHFSVCLDGGNPANNPPGSTEGHNWACEKGYWQDPLPLIFPTPSPTPKVV